MSCGITNSFFFNEQNKSIPLKGGVKSYGNPLILLQLHFQDPVYFWQNTILFQHTVSEINVRLDHHAEISIRGPYQVMV
jgi:hypothetical protein